MLYIQWNPDFSNLPFAGVSTLRRAVWEKQIFFWEYEDFSDLPPSSYLYEWHATEPCKDRQREHILLKALCESILPSMVLVNIFCWNCVLNKEMLAVSHLMNIWHSNMKTKQFNPDPLISGVQCLHEIIWNYRINSINKQANKNK